MTPCLCAPAPLAVPLRLLLLPGAAPAFLSLAALCPVSALMSSRLLAGLPFLLAVRAPPLASAPAAWLALVLATAVVRLRPVFSLLCVSVLLVSRVPLASAVRLWTSARPPLPLARLVAPLLGSELVAPRLVFRRPAPGSLACLPRPLLCPSPSLPLSPLGAVCCPNGLGPPNSRLPLGLARSLPPKLARRDPADRPASSRCGSLPAFPVVPAGEQSVWWRCFCGFEVPPLPGATMLRPSTSVTRTAFTALPQLLVRPCTPRATALLLPTMPLRGAGRLTACFPAA